MFTISHITQNCFQDMEFGHLPQDLLGTADLQLPADPPLNAAVLPGKRAEHPRLWLGATRWTQPDWIGNLYPSHARAADFLKYYAAQFNSIELNGTHYKVYDAKALARWRSQVEASGGRPEFLFAPKLYQGITHRGSLKGKEALVDAFVQGLEGLASTLSPQSSTLSPQSSSGSTGQQTGTVSRVGPVFIQLSESFGPGRQVELLEFLSTLPQQVAWQQAPLQWMVELRHPDWFKRPALTENFFATLRTLGVGAVITDVAGRRDVCHLQLPVARTMVRFVANQQHPTDYPRLEAWAQRLANWFDAGLEEAVFFLHMGDDRVVPDFARFAANTLQEATGIPVPAPVRQEGLPSQGSLF